MTIGIFIVGQMVYFHVVWLYESIHLSTSYSSIRSPVCSKENKTILSNLSPKLKSSNPENVIFTLSAAIYSMLTRTAHNIPGTIATSSPNFYILCFDL